MSAQTIFDTAPLGALVRFSDGEPKPPARFSKKLARWENRNGIGRLVRKDPATRRGDHCGEASISLHLGDFISGGIVIVIAHATFGVSHPLAFEIVERPSASAVRILQPFGTTFELLHLAPNKTDAEAWLRAHPSYGAIIESADVTFSS
jgi:hypothetical protein